MGIGRENTSPVVDGATQMLLRLGRLEDQVGALERGRLENKANIDSLEKLVTTNQQSVNSNIMKLMGGMIVSLILLILDIALRFSGIK